LTQAEYQADSILIGQSKVDDQYVECSLDSKALGRLAIRGSLHLVSRFLKRTAQETLYIDFVFNEQKAHE
jgi:hypothetical protein